MMIAMYIGGDAVREMECRYCRPAVCEWEHGISAEEMAMVRASQKHGRAHDVTLFIFDGEQLALIRKPSFPPEGYRAPSGGVAPGEGFEAGALREAYEETGLSVALECYVLRVQVRFTCGAEHLDWTTHVFQARATGGTLGTLDPGEIDGTCYATPAALQGPIRSALLATGRPLLAYRVRLTDVVVPLLTRNR